MNTIYPLLDNDCKPYLDLIRSCKPGSMLVRGMNEEIYSYKILDHDIKNRQPLHTPIGTHDAINDVYFQKYGWKVRNGIFCYGINIFTCEKIYDLGYGTNYLVFPIGDLKFAYSLSVFDMYELVGFNEITLNELIAKLDYKNDNICQLFSNMEDTSGYTNEIMIMTSRYYLVNIKFKEKLAELIWK